MNEAKFRQLDPINGKRCVPDDLEEFIITSFQVCTVRKKIEDLHESLLSAAKTEPLHQ
jgi:hypothetical protein